MAASTVLDPALFAQLEFEARADGSDFGVQVDRECGRGRVLRAMRDFSSGEVVLSAPCEHQVMKPQKCVALEPSCSSTETEHKLVGMFSRMKAICSAVGSKFSDSTYWAALLSLTADEVPFGAEWPSISAEKQARLLQLFRPPYLSSLCEGRCLLGVLAESSNPTAVTEKLPTFTLESSLAADDEAPLHSVANARAKAHTCDMAVRAFCKEFALRIQPSKLEDLVMVWKYNSFISASPAEGFDMFMLLAFCNHACSPNCKYYVDGANGHMELVVGRNGLEAGDEITISYLSEERLAKMETHERREVLADNWLFFCCCARCSLTSALPRCPSCSPSAIMEVLVCDEEEEVYPGLEVVCDVCEDEDLQFLHSYFFHCGSCGSDICPGCAAKQVEPLSEAGH